MSTDWILKLHKAATQADARQILHLIEEILEQHCSLRNAIVEQVNNFRFDSIMETTRQALR